MVGESIGLLMGVSIKVTLYKGENKEKENLLQLKVISLIKALFLTIACRAMVK